MEKKLKDKTMSFRMEPEMYSEIEELAKFNSLPLATFMRVVCKQWIVYTKQDDSLKQSITLTIEGKKVQGVLHYDRQYAPSMHNIFKETNEVKFKDKIANKPKKKVKIANS